ncbi:MAG: hypothetical protein ACK5RL_07695 [Acidimicrobiales bacterium]
MESPTTPDPARDLVELERARHASALEPVLDFGPWWYAPVFAALLAGVAAGSYSGVVSDSWVARFFLLAGLLLVSFHQYQARRFVGRWSRLSVVMTLAVAALVVLVVFLWTLVQSLLDLSGAPAYLLLLAGWVVVTLLLLAVRAGLGRLRRQVWSPA